MRSGSVPSKRSASPVLPILSMSAGVCMSGTKGPKTALRGPLTMASAAASWAAFMASRAGSGRRSLASGAKP